MLRKIFANFLILSEIKRVDVFAEKIEEMGTKPLIELLEDLGGWPVLQGNEWNESEFDWVELMAMLRTYNNDILLSEMVGADITNSSYHIIQVNATVFFIANF